MGKLLAAAFVLTVSMGPMMASAAPSMGAAPIEHASSPILQEAHYYRHHHYYYRRHYYRHHYYYRHHRHYW